VRVADDGEVLVRGYRRLGQVGKAFVVARGQVTATELIAWSRDRMAGFKVPRYVEFRDGLPLNATGKVMKDRLVAAGGG
jgi:acyl-CoA synthetase (AMP-forming)/AMP-acid ligase II